MQVGDAVKLCNGPKAFSRLGSQVGIIIAKQHYTVPDGNPDGDFTRHVKWKVLFGDEILVCKNPYHLEVINV